MPTKANMNTVYIKIKSFEEMVNAAISIDPNKVNLKNKAINIPPYFKAHMLPYCNTIQAPKINMYGEKCSYYRTENYNYGNWMVEKLYTYEEVLKLCPEILI